MSLENKSLAMSLANVSLAGTSLANPSIPRRNILAGMAALGWCGFAPRARAAPSSARPLAERLAAYADGLRYGDLDDATIEAVKTHLIDTLGCAIAAFDERPVRVCRDVALAAAAGDATVIGTDRRTSPSTRGLRQRRRARATTTSTTSMSGASAGPSQRHHRRVSRRRRGRACRARRTSSPRSRSPTRSTAACSTRSTSARAAGTRRCSACRRWRSPPAS